MRSNKFLDTVSRYAMLQPGDQVLVGFSGGADSVCLLHLLYEYQDTLRISLRAAHVHHGLRGAEADRDEQFVRRFCAERNIPIEVLHADISALAKQRGQSTELCARDVRYRFFHSLRPDKIATAHTASDAVETLLMNLSRGASLHGLASIPPVRGIIIRPLIEFLRSETEAWCAAHGLEYVTDSTNLTEDYTRNKYRNTVIQEIKRISPAFERNAARCLENLRSEDDFMRQQAHAAGREVTDNEQLIIEKYSSLHPALRYRVLCEFLNGAGVGEYEMKHLALLDRNMKTAGYALTLPEGKIVASDGTRLFLSTEHEKAQSEAPVFLKKDTLSGTVFNGVDLSFEITESDGSCVFNTNSIDFSKIDDIICIRSRRAGDTVRLARRNCSKTLKKLYCELSVPLEFRDRAPVIADEKGIIWAYGAGADRSRLADKNTIIVLNIHSGSDKNDS